MSFHWLTYLRWLSFPALLLGAALVAGIVLLAFASAIIYPTLPSLEVLTVYRPKFPRRVHSADGKLIGEFGEERRALVSIKDVPKPLINAILAAEDERFYQHSGVDYVGVARAAMSNQLPHFMKVKGKCEWFWLVFPFVEWRSVQLGVEPEDEPKDSTSSGNSEPNYA